MNIRVICIGFLKERYWKEACEEYLSRIKPYCQIEVIECDDYPCKEGSSEAVIAQVKEKEAERVLKLLKPNDYVIALDLNHTQYDSVAFAEFLDSRFVRGGSSLTFLIGGSLGLADSLKQRANESVTFGKMTFPHQLSRVMLLEQIYRAFRILHHEPYHK